VTLLVVGLVDATHVVVSVRRGEKSNVQRLGVKE
jgi:hypothetical protein